MPLSLTHFKSDYIRGVIDSASDVLSFTVLDEDSVYVACLFQFSGFRRLTCFICMSRAVRCFRQTRCTSLSTLLISIRLILCVHCNAWAELFCQFILCLLQVKVN